MVNVREVGPPRTSARHPALVRAFWTFPESVHLLPDEDRRRAGPAAVPRVGRARCRGPRRPDGSRGRRDAGGGARLVASEAYPLSSPARRVSSCTSSRRRPGPSARPREARRGQEANRAPDRGRPPHYWLRAIGVDPAWQGRGVGTELIRPVLDRADHERRGAYLLTATPGNVTWYEGLGFSTVALFDPPPAGRRCGRCGASRSADRSWGPRRDSRRP